MTKKITPWLATLLPAVAAAGLLFTGNAAAQPSTPQVATGHRMQISEIYYNSPGPDTGSNSSLNAEWVELHNTSGDRISLTHWILHDGGQKHTFTFGTYTIGPHGYVKIHTGKGSRTQTNRYWNLSWYVWNNTGDTATLKDTHGNVIDRCSYSDPSESNSHVNC
jgi:Lamin Tail Domain